jgi:hypothetical protein
VGNLEAVVDIDTRKRQEQMRDPVVLPDSPLRSSPSRSWRTRKPGSKSRSVVRARLASRRSRRAGDVRYKAARREIEAHDRLIAIRSPF